MHSRVDATFDAGPGSIDLWIYDDSYSCKDCGVTAFEGPVAQGAISCDTVFAP